MVHHLAELMTRAEHAESEQARSAATESAVTLILTIWEHRAYLPHGMNPMNSFSQVLGVLNQLNAPANPWNDRPGTSYQALGAKLYGELRRVTIGLLLIDALPTLRQTSASWDDVARFLSKEEREILLGLQSWPRILFATTTKKTKADDPEVLTALRTLTDAALKTLNDLRNRLATDVRLRKPMAPKDKPAKRRKKTNT